MIQILFVYTSFISELHPELLINFLVGIDLSNFSE